MRKLLLEGITVALSIAASILAAESLVYYSIPFIVVAAIAYAIYSRTVIRRNDNDVADLISGILKSDNSMPLLSRIGSANEERFWFNRMLQNALERCRLAERPRQSFGQLIDSTSALGETAAILAGSLEDGSDSSKSLSTLLARIKSGIKSHVQMHPKMQSAYSVCAMSSCAFFPAFAGIGATIISFAGSISGSPISIGYISMAALSYVALSILAYSSMRATESSAGKVSMMFAVAILVFKSSFLISSHFAI